MRRKTTQEFIDEVRLVVGDEYTILSDYVNALTKVSVKHEKCGRIYPVRPGDFLHLQSRCPQCFGKMKKSTESFAAEVCEASNDEYRVVGKYVNSHTKISILHTSCESVFEAQPGNFLSGSRCPTCYGTPKKTTVDFIQEVKDVYGEEYTVIGRYQGRHKKIKVRHSVCNHEWYVRPGDFLRGQNCQGCNSPKGETEVCKFLIKHNIRHVRQFKFEDCKRKLPLPFDFAVFDGDCLFCLVEFDGQQHFHPIDYFGGEDAYAYRQTNDNIKTDYCKQSGISLIRIPYWDIDKVSQILSASLSELLGKEVKTDGTVPAA